MNETDISPGGNVVDDRVAVKESRKYSFLALLAITMYTTTGTPSDIAALISSNLGVRESSLVYLFATAIQVFLMYTAIVWMGKASGIKKKGTTAGKKPVG